MGTADDSRFGKNEYGYPSSNNRVSKIVGGGEVISPWESTYGKDPYGSSSPINDKVNKIVGREPPPLSSFEIMYGEGASW